MASKAASLLCLNLLLFTLLTSIPSSFASRTLTASCQDSLKLDACVDLLNDLVKLNVGNPDHPCCSLLGDLVKLEARACLCTSLTLNVLNLIHLNIPNLSLNLLLSNCKSKLPPGFQCS